jgi:hypothetical protein
MANKYDKQSKAAQRKARKAHGKSVCEKKKSYETREEAHQKGQEVYKCKFCKKWHRSGSLISLLSKAKKKAERQKDNGEKKKPKPRPPRRS